MLATLYNHKIWEKSTGWVKGDDSHTVKCCHCAIWIWNSQNIQCPAHLRKKCKSDKRDIEVTFCFSGWLGVWLAYSPTTWSCSGSSRALPYKFSRDGSVIFDPVLLWLAIDICCQTSVVKVACYPKAVLTKSLQTMACAPIAMIVYCVGRSQWLHNCHNLWLHKDPGVYDLLQCIIGAIFKMSLIGQGKR
jgi:hypothetical protein